MITERLSNVWIADAAVTALTLAACQEHADKAAADARDAASKSAAEANEAAMDAKEK